MFNHYFVNQPNIQGIKDLKCLSFRLNIRILTMKIPICETLHLLKLDVIFEAVHERFFSAQKEFFMTKRQFYY